MHHVFHSACGSVEEPGDGLKTGNRLVAFSARGQYAWSANLAANILKFVCLHTRYVPVIPVKTFEMGAIGVKIHKRCSQRRRRPRRCSPWRCCSGRTRARRASRTSGSRVRPSTAHQAVRRLRPKSALLLSRVSCKLKLQSHMYVHPYDRDFVFTANGCGTAMLPINSDVDFADCCNWHDAVRGVALLGIIMRFC